MVREGEARCLVERGNMFSGSEVVVSVQTDLLGYPHQLALQISIQRLTTGSTIELE